MNLSVLSDKLQAILAEISKGPMTVWSAIRVVDAILHFFLALAGQENADSGQIRFGATADEHERFVSTCQEAVKAFRGNAFTAPSGPAVAEGRLAEFALEQLFAAVKEWIAAQGYASVFELLLDLLRKTMVPISAAVEVEQAAPTEDV